MNVRISIEQKRGCGYRSSGADGVGIYLVGPPGGEECERLPFPVHVCPACGQGIRPSRAPRWVQPSELFALNNGPICDPRIKDHDHNRCPICTPGLLERALLIWIGEKHYATAAHFMLEAYKMGISRKLAAIPRDFVIGEDYVLIAHKNAIPDDVKFAIADQKKIEDLVWEPGIFYVWRPAKVELVIDNENDIPEKALNIQKQHGEDKVEIIKVVRDVDVTML